MSVIPSLWGTIHRWNNNLNAQWLLLLPIFILYVHTPHLSLSLSLSLSLFLSLSPPLSIHTHSQNRQFNYDYVLQPTCTQTQVYSIAAKPLVQGTYIYIHVYMYVHENTCVRSTDHSKLKPLKWGRPFNQDTYGITQTNLSPKTRKHKDILIFDNSVDLSKCKFNVSSICVRVYALSNIRIYRLELFLHTNCWFNACTYMYMYSTL